MFMLLLAFVALAESVTGQTLISGVVNQYTSVYDFVGNNKILVSDLTGFELNDRVLIIQMQGATIDENNTSSFGTITDTGSAGLYEFNTICCISGDTLTLEYELSNTYSVSGKTLGCSHTRIHRCYHQWHIDGRIME